MDFAQLGGIFHEFSWRKRRLGCAKDSVREYRLYLSSFGFIDLLDEVIRRLADS